MNKMRGVVGKRVKVASLNAHLICVICSGYYVEATTIVECLHTFCRSCIINYLKSSKFCPICDVQIHHSKPWSSLRADKTMQDLVYKLVPGLYQDEMRRRRKFYSELSETANGESRDDEDGAQPTGVPAGLDGEERGHLPHGARFFAQDDSISLSLEYYTGQSDADAEEKVGASENEAVPARRYLQCPAAVTVRHLKKFLQMKYGIGVDGWVDIIYNDECLPDYFSLIDVAYTFDWRRTSPMRLSYRIFTRKTVKSVKTGTAHKTTTTTRQSSSADEESKTTSMASGKYQTSLEQQRQSEYLGNLNLNPTRSGFLRTHCNNINSGNNNNSSTPIANNNNRQQHNNKLNSKMRNETDEFDKTCQSSDDSNASASLNIVVSSERGESDEDGSPTRKSKHKRKHQDGDRRRKSFGEEKRRRKSCSSDDGDDEEDDPAEPRFVIREDEVPLANLKNEALRKVFVVKEKAEAAQTKGKDDEVKRKKRKKSKHHEGDAKKRRMTSEKMAESVVPTSPSILSFAKDPLKLKVKLTSIVKPPAEEEKKVDKVEVDEIEEEVSKKKEKKEEEDVVKKTTTTMTDKERLLHLRAVRHKNIIKTNAQGYINAPRSLTISKVDASDASATKPRIVETRPSLEIMLIPPDASKAKSPDAAPTPDVKSPKPAKPTADTFFGVLDLSEKSTRAKDAPDAKKSAQQSIMQIAQTLVNRKLASPMLQDKRYESVGDPTTAAAAMRNLKTLSDTAVNILMAAQSKGFPASPESPKRNGTGLAPLPPPSPATKDCENGHGLKIPAYPITRDRIPPPVPNLHEIYPKSRGGRPVPSTPLPPRSVSVTNQIKPGQNQSVRHIPNPSALLNRQNNNNNNNQILTRLPGKTNGTDPTRPTSPTTKLAKLGSIPPLQSIKSKVILQEDGDGKKVNGTSSDGFGLEKAAAAAAVAAAASLKVGSVHHKRMESLARNIESVAAGLTARAVSNAMVDAK